MDDPEVALTIFTWETGEGRWTSVCPQLNLTAMGGTEAGSRQRVWNLARDLVKKDPSVLRDLRSASVSLIKFNPRNGKERL